MGTVPFIVRAVPHYKGTVPLGFGTVPFANGYRQRPFWFSVGTRLETKTNTCAHPASSTGTVPFMVGTVPMGERLLAETVLTHRLRETENVSEFQS